MYVTGPFTGGVWRGSLYGGTHWKVWLTGLHTDIWGNLQVSVDDWVVIIPVFITLFTQFC